MTNYVSLDNHVQIQITQALPGLSNPGEIALRPFRPSTTISTEERRKQYAAIASVRKMLDAQASFIAWEEAAGNGDGETEGKIPYVLRTKCGLDQDSINAADGAFRALAKVTGGGMIRFERIHEAHPKLKDSNGEELSALEWTRSVLMGDEEGQRLLTTSHWDTSESIAGEDLRWLAALVWFAVSHMGADDTLTWISADEKASKGLRILARRIHGLRVAHPRKLSSGQERRVAGLTG